jgi:TonB family protein
LAAEQQEIQGEVVVEILVTEAGEVGETKVIRGNPILADSVVGAVKKWKFAPFIRNGKPAKAAAALIWDFAFKDKIIVDKPYVPPATSASLTLSPEQPTSTADNSQQGISKVARPMRVRIASGVTQGLLVRKVAPVYPLEAKQNRIQGTVFLAAVIGKDGRVENLRVLSGPKELVDAAVGAVQQWRYRPYVLNGEPVEVDTTVTVNFVLSRF